MKDAHQIQPTPVRLPDDLKVWIKHKAIDNHRSMNSEIIARLEESRKRDGDDAKAA